MFDTLLTRDRIRFASILIILPLIAAALAWGGINLTRNESRIAAVWLPNALIVAFLLRSKRRAALTIIPLTFSANVVVNMLGGDGAVQAASLAAINAVEVLLVYAGMRHLGLARPNMERLTDLLAFCAVGGVVAPVCSGLLAAMTLGNGDLAASWDVFVSWSVADALGLLLVTPTLLIFADAWQRRRHPSRVEIGEYLLLFAVGTMVTVAVFVQTRYPFLFIVVPVVVLHAFKQGSLGTAISIIKITIIASVATSLNHGPINLVVGGLSDQLMTLQVFLATSFAVGLPVAALLKNRDSIRDALRERHAFADFILANAGNVIFRTNKEGRWTFLNAEWEDLTGYTVEESLGRPTTQLLVPEDVEQAMDFYPKIASGEVESCVLHQRFQDARGAWRYIEVTVQRFVDEGGAFAGTVGNIQDVSDKKRQELALKDSEKRFRRMAESAPVGIFRADAGGQLTYVNKVWSDKVGLRPKEMLGDGWQSALVDGEEFEIDPPWRNIRGPGEVRRRVAQFRSEDGTPLWLETVTTAEFDEDGRITGFVGVANDITDQRRAMAELHESRAQLSLLADNVSDAVFRLDLDGTCRYASPSARSLLGISPRALIGAKLLDRLHPDDETSVVDAFKKLATGRSERERIAFRSERIDMADAYIWLEANCGLVREDADQTPRSIVASIRNIDATKTLENDLRTERDRAERAALAKSAFLANMSHEIRTPMNGVIGFTDLLLKSDLLPPQRQQAEIIAESGRTMMQLLNDILDISKIEAGQMKLQVEPVDIRHKTTSTVRLMHPIAQGKGISLDLEVASDVPEWISGDQLRLRQVLLNLLGNAVKFTHEGGVRVCVDRERQSEDDYLVIAISDSGIGIAEDRLTMIFEQFTQADGSTARKYGGTGLGLAISARLVDMMGGTVRVDSKLGEGTTFTVRLPLAVCAAPAVSNDDVCMCAATRDDLRSRVLVAEDHDVNQALIRSQAERIGIAVDIASDGAEAVAMAIAARDDGKPYNLILMDMQMPRIDGLAATRQLRALGFSADDLPIVALTANAYADDIAACLASGMQHHLAKPVQLPELQRIIERFAPHYDVASARQHGTHSVDAALLLNSALESDPTESEVSVEALTAILDLPPALISAYQARRREALEALQKQVRCAKVDKRTIADLADKLHKLGGTAANFGEIQLGRDALALENELLTADLADFANVVKKYPTLLAG